LPRTTPPAQAPIPATTSEAVASTAPAVASPPETTFPSQAEIFEREGELLAVGYRKGDITLDTIVKYVERMANLDDLDSVWNALTEMNVADNIKKRWIKLYSQNLPTHKITDELKERIESGPEEEKKVRTKGEVSPKPKSFSLIGNEIIGDLEGGLTFKEALQERAQNLGMVPDQANSLATTIEAMKVGPEMASSLLTALLPLLNKPPDTRAV
jgi:hypothetical protein